MQFSQNQTLVFTLRNSQSEVILDSEVDSKIGADDGVPQILHFIEVYTLVNEEFWVNRFKVHT